MTISTKQLNLSRYICQWSSLLQFKVNALLNYKCFITWPEFRCRCFWFIDYKVDVCNLMQFILYDNRYVLLDYLWGPYAYNVSTLEGWHPSPTGNSGSATDYVKWRMGRKRVYSLPANMGSRNKRYKSWMCNTYQIFSRKKLNRSMAFKEFLHLNQMNYTVFSPYHVISCVSLTCDVRLAKFLPSIDAPKQPAFCFHPGKWQNDPNHREMHPEMWSDSWGAKSAYILLPRVRWDSYSGIPN